MAATRGGIDKETLEALVDEGLTTRAIAVRLDRGLGTVRHWLATYGLRTAYTQRLDALRDARGGGPTERKIECPRCGPTLHRFFPNRGFVCLRCRSAAVSRRRRKVKAILVAEAGGACVRCGYSESIAALQFHHVNPATKEFHISRRGVTRSLERARAEARKCILLCANCHATIEASNAALI